MIKILDHIKEALVGLKITNVEIDENNNIFFCLDNKIKLDTQSDVNCVRWAPIKKTN